MSEEKTFVREVTFQSPTFDGKGHVLKSVTKQVTFKELDSRDKEQHTLHFKIISLYTANKRAGDEDADPDEKPQDRAKRRVLMDTDIVCELTKAAVKKLVVVDETEFTKIDRQEFLADSLALIPFGMWFLTEKAFPFFQNATSVLKD